MAILRLQGELEKRAGIYYQVDSAEEPIGAGGMGQVFKGVKVNEKTGATRPVAIKFMYDDLPLHAVERARREASIQLRNDNLVEMLGFIETQEKAPLGEIRKHYHIVSELLTGVSLSDLFDGRTTDRDGIEVPFAVKMLQDYKNDSEHFARTIVMNVLSGLMALHDAGYIHRDIDPSNIMLTREGHIKLIDFGIAKQMNNLTTGDKSVTKFGDFMGKAEYASPELVLGDIRHQNQTTDIYAMGILLYHCIVGHPPFEGPRHEVLEKQLKSKIPLGPVKNKILRNIIRVACEKKQEQRYQTSAQMRVSLETMKESKPVNKPFIVVSLSVMVVVIAIAAILYSWSGKNSVQKTDQPLLTGVAKATNLMRQTDTAKDGFVLLKDLANNGDANATYLLSRLYFSRVHNEYDADSIRIMRQSLTDAGGIKTDFVKAHELLLKVVELNPHDYHALYELGRDCLAGVSRDHEKELTIEDFRLANDYYTKALEYAKAQGDQDYIERIEEQMEMIKTVI